ncbi:adaptor protein MecA [Streptococcus merionis]|uniref:adaptor protein MecA n=1 Tax=Streptococcus merionis TaxID=400065 RepID=UPI0026F32153|nr:adaptor protein MecA [Streptococcus merionis]
MEVKQISESTLKITIKLDDLEARGMELSDFLIPQEKTEEFFYSILDELEMPEHFLHSGMLSFRVTPKPDKLDIFVTKSDIDQELDFQDLAEMANVEDISHLSPDDFFSTLEKTLKSKSSADSKAVAALELLESQMAQEEQPAEDEEMSRYVYFTLRFKDLSEAIGFAKSVDYPVDTSELYKYNGAYYMTILLDFLNETPRYASFMHARIMEHAEDTGVTRPYLQEHGYVMLQVDAIERLKKVELV